MDLEQYRLSSNIKCRIIRSQQTRLVFYQKFLRGPIPLNWLRKAMSLGGTCLSVGIILWYYRGLKKSITFKLGIQDIANLIGRSWLTAQRGLRALERSGLVAIKRHRGRKHLIEIQEVEKETNSNTSLQK